MDECLAALDKRTKTTPIESSSKPEDDVFEERSKTPQPEEKVVEVTTPATEEKAEKRKTLSKDEKKRKAMERKKEEFIALFPQKDIDIKDIQLSYDSPKIEKDFNNLFKTNNKIKELMEEIENNTWATVGAGQPEVLKHMDGAISRRINKEDRLVYKVIGAGKIHIYSCEGHYNK